MPPFDFPNAPTVNQVVTGPNGAQYKWDGTKWVTVIPTGGGGGGSSVIISDTAPTAPTAAELWFDSVGLQTYIWYTDPTSSQWTPVINQGGLLSDAPSNGVLYGRMNGAWSQAGTVTSVGLQMPALFSVANSPVTGSGTIAVNIPNQGQNTVWAGPASGGSGQPVFRALTATDVPTLAYLPLTGGTLTGNLTLSYALPIIYLNKTTPTNSNFIAGQTNGVNRWSILLGDATAESGSNAGSNFQLVASADNGSSLGAALLINRATALATFTGAGIVVNTSNGGLGLNGAIASQRAIDFYTNGSDRWRIYANQVAESGSNAGSDFNISCFADNGAFIATPFQISRATGNATFSQGLNCGQLAVNSANPFIYLDRNSGTTGNCIIISQTNGVNRWAMYLNDGASETGGDAGSNFGLAAVHDNGSFYNWVLQINRASLESGFNGHVSCVVSPGGYDPNGRPYVTTGYYSNGQWYAGEQLAVAASGGAGLIGYNHSGNNVQWSTSASDRRLKSNLKAAGDAISVIKQLTVYDLDFKPRTVSNDRSMPEPRMEHWPFSLIADEVGAVMPHATIRNREEDGIEYHVALHPTHLIATLWRAVQQLSSELDALKAKVGAV